MSDELTERFTMEFSLVITEQKCDRHEGADLVTAVSEPNSSLATVLDFHQSELDCLHCIAERLHDGWSLSGVTRRPSGAYLTRFTRPRNRPPPVSEGGGRHQVEAPRTPEEEGECTISGSWPLVSARFSVSTCSLNSCGRSDMNFEDFVGLAVGVAVAIYILYCLFRAEEM